MQSRRNLMKTGLAAGAFATANVAAQAADGKEPRRTGDGELPRNLTLLSIRQDDDLVIFQ
jgi:hypothetical protein